MDKKKASAEKNAKQRSKQKKKQSNEPTRQVDKAWGDSKARKVLLYYLKKGVFPLEADAEDEGRFSEYPVFMKYDKEKWEERLEACRTIVRKRKKEADRDAKCFANFRKANPEKTHNDFGQFNWKGSDVDEKLRKDVKDGKHKQFAKPSKFLASDTDYEGIDKKRFRDRIHQFERARKFQNYVESKNDEKLKSLGLEEDES
jgi:hypothetical protein